MPDKRAQKYGRTHQQPGSIRGKSDCETGIRERVSGEIVHTHSLTHTSQTPKSRLWPPYTLNVIIFP